MTEPELFDGIKLLVNLLEHNLYSGMQGAIVECYSDKAYKVEFTNLNGESIALCTLLPEQFIVVWKAKTKTWLSVAEQVAAIVNHLSEERLQEVLDFAVFCVRGSYIYCRGDPPHTINIAQPLILSGRPASGKLFGI